MLQLCFGLVLQFSTIVYTLQLGCGAMVSNVHSIRSNGLEIGVVFSRNLMQYVHSEMYSLYRRNENLHAVETVRTVHCNSVSSLTIKALP